MRNRKITIALLITLSISFIGTIGIISVVSAKTDDSVIPLEKMAAMDLTHENFKEKETIVPVGSSGTTEPAGVGDTVDVTVSDDWYGTVYDVTFRVVKEGAHCLILIDQDAYDVSGIYSFANPSGTWGFTEHIITDAQLEYMKNEFDTNIYEKVTTIYGIPKSRPDVEPPDPDADKIWILIFNIRDWAYYEEEADYYVAGYFSASTNSIEDKNIIHIDTYYWADRVGPGVGRPYLYEGVIAHEFEHLVHYDVDSDEESWLDEGLADLAGFFCGYGHSSGHIANYLVYHPYTALTFWGNALEDYGASYLFALYLYEKFGEADFISDLVAETANGIEGIQNTLDAWFSATEDPKYDTTFDEIYDAWTIAVYFDDLEKGSPYGFDTLDIGTEDTWGYSINYAINHIWFQPNPFLAPVAFPNLFGPIMPYTTHYYVFGSSSPTVNVLLEGDIESGPGPFDGENSWYSDVGAWAWRSIYRTLDLTEYDDKNEIVLNFYTYFEIEDDWDYGYVEVHDIDDNVWVTLEDPLFRMEVYNPQIGDTEDVAMRNYVAIPQDNPYTPYEQEPTTYEDAKVFHAFTGFSHDWDSVTMDLSDFAGKRIELHFRTWQDGAFTYQMMYVDNILITVDGVEILPFDPCEVNTGWSISQEFKDSPFWYIFDCRENNFWHGTFIETFKEPQKNPTGNRWEPSKKRELVNGPTPIEMSLGTSWFLEYPTDIQQGFLWNLPASPTRNKHSMVLIVSNRADHILPGMYYAAFF